MLRFLYLCFLASNAGGARVRTTRRQEARTQEKRRGVLLVGIDGVQWKLLKSLDNASALTGLHAAPGECGGVEKHGALQPTNSGPCWSTILTGVWANQHDIWTNGGGAAAEDVPSIFQIVRDGVLQRDSREAKVACVVHWTPIHRYFERDRTPLWSTGDDDKVTQETIRLLEDEDGMDFIMTHLDVPDGVGHSKGGFGRALGDSIHDASVRVGRMHDAMKARAQQRGEEWLLLVTTDHGREWSGYNHGGQSLLEREWFMLSSMPFDATPWARSSLQVDVVPTIAHFLGLPQAAPKWQGSPLIGAPQGPARLTIDAKTDEGVELTWSGDDAAVALFRNEERLNNTGRPFFDRYRQIGTEVVEYRVVSESTQQSSQLHLELYRPSAPGDCDESMSGTKGAGYRGCQSQTQKGTVCQRWTTQNPNTHDRTPQAFPDSGLGDHSFCRNPDGEATIWCYTADPDNRWDYCDPLPLCDETLTGTKDEGYRGCQTRTRSGAVCQRWTSQSPNVHTRIPLLYPNSGLDDNFCRNPGGEDTIWCYTVERGRWGYCDPRAEPEAQKPAA